MRLLLILILFFFSFTIKAQDWKQMMDDPIYNIYEVVEVAETYFENIDKNKKGSGWKKFQRWLFENEPKFYPSGDRMQVDPHYASKAYKNFLNKNSSVQKSIFDGEWEELGPYYIEEVTGHYAVGLGRVESFYIDDDPNIIYLGSRSGGFWKTSDGGENWVNTTDDLIATGVNTIAVNPNDSNKILINIRNSNNGTTHGIYESTDGGNNWSITNFSPVNLNWGGLGTNDRINLIKYHPTIPELVFIGTSKGLYRSSDNLITWNLVGQPWDNFSQIDFHPTNNSIVYVSKTNEDSNILISNDTGSTFSNSGSILFNNSNIKISISNNCENCIFLGSSDGIWKSTDLGSSFEVISGLYIEDISNYGAFAVSDVNSDVILYGDIDTHMSFDGGANFEKTTFWSEGNSNYDQTGTYVHADLRGAVCKDGVFWVNTDGLLCKSEDNGVSWEIFEGQSIRENYNLGVSQSNHYRTISGSQDNGTSIKTENSWIEFYGADGMEGIIHPLNHDWMIGSFQFGGKRRTKDGGYTQDGVGNVENGGWIAPLFYDPIDQMKIYSLGDKVTVSEDFGSTWNDLGTPFGLTESVNYATIAENNSDNIVVTRGNQIKLSVDGGTTFTSIESNLPNNYITDVAFDPNNDDIIIVTYGSYNGNNNKVYVVDYDMKQAEVVMYAKGSKLNKDEFSIIMFHNEYFGGGMSSIVFQEMRESKALAYSVYSTYTIPKEIDNSHYQFSYVGTQADKLDDAMAGMLGLLTQMPEATANFENAKEAVLQKIRTERITKQKVIDYYEASSKINIDYDQRKDLYEKVSSFSMEDLREFHNSHVQNDSYTYMVLGSLEELDMDVLRTYGDVNVLTLEDVFGY